MYAEGSSPRPEELIIAGYIDRFGAQAVLGRVLSGGELRRIAQAENIVQAYRDRQKSENWAKWAQDNPEQAAVLNEAERLANGE